MAAKPKSLADEFMITVRNADWVEEEERAFFFAIKNESPYTIPNAKPVNTEMSIVRFFSCLCASSSNR